MLNEKTLIMKRYIMLSLAAAVLVSSCGTYAGQGAYVGASFGSVIGSAVGGISGGWRGSDVGTLVGMAGGALVGGAIGAQADKAREENFERKYHEHRSAAAAGSGDYVNNRHESAGDDGWYGDDDVRSHNAPRYSSDGGRSEGRDYGDGVEFDPTGSGDDTLYDFQSSDYTGSYTASEPSRVAPSMRYEEIELKDYKAAKPLEVRNARFVDDNEDNSINSDEMCKLIFEVYNVGDAPVYDVQPMVKEVTGLKRILVSGTIHVERINPGKGIRYTAMVKAGKNIKGDNAVFRVYAVKGNNVEASNVIEFKVDIKK